MILEIDGRSESPPRPKRSATADGSPEKSTLYIVIASLIEASGWESSSVVVLMGRHSHYHYSCAWELVDADAADT
jgi:hypothetical protein